MLKADRRLRISLLSITLLCLMMIASLAQADLSRFVGDYAGSAEVEIYDGSTAKRDMSVSIKTTKDGFRLRWTTTTYRDTDAKAKTYVINFVDSARDGVYAAAMKRNVFGHEVPLDPMKGEPYLWARVKGDTLSVYSLFVNADGSYELQQYDRTLVEDGLQLEFKRLNEGQKLRTINTVLKRQ